LTHWSVGASGSTAGNWLSAGVVEVDNGEVLADVGFGDPAAGGEQQQESLGLTIDGPWSGTVHFSRVGGVGSAYARFNSVTLQTLDGHAFPDEEINLFITIGGWDYDVVPADPVVAHVDEARITSEAGDMSDSFDCDTLMPAQAL
jgi:hypothetical protein